MRIVVGFFAASLSLLIASAARAQEKTEPVSVKDRIVGEWQLQDPALAKAEGKATLEFTRDGTVKVRISTKGMRDVEMNATYKLDGDKILMTRKKGGNDETETMSIKILTADRMVFVDKGKDVELKRLDAAAKPTDQQNARAAEALDAKQLLGSWEITGQQGVIAKFGEDGQIVISSGTLVVLNGTYRLDKSKIVINVKGPEGKEITDTLSIKTLTAEKLVTVDSMGKEESLRRANDGKAEAPSPFPNPASLFVTLAG